MTIFPDGTPAPLVECLALVGIAALLARAIGGLGAWLERDRTPAWAVRFVCPGCDRRYHAWQGSRFFLPFEICPECGTDKSEFRRTDCAREADGAWTDRADLEAVERALRGGPGA